MYPYNFEVKTGYNLVHRHKVTTSQWILRVLLKEETYGN